MNEPEEDDDFPPEEYGDPVGRGEDGLRMRIDRDGEPLYMESWDA